MQSCMEYTNYVSAMHLNIASWQSIVVLSTSSQGFSSYIFVWSWIASSLSSSALRKNTDKNALFLKRLLWKIESICEKCLLGYNKHCVNSSCLYYYYYSFLEMYSNCCKKINEKVYLWSYNQIQLEILKAFLINISIVS